MPTLTLPKLDQPKPISLTRISLVSYGVRIGIEVNKPSILEQLIPYLPPGWKPSPSVDVDEMYSVKVNESYGYHQLYRNQEQLIQTEELEDIFETLDSDIRIQVAVDVQDRLFVHAGVVGWRDKAIIIPGRSFSGKTTLVAALVKAGATYYSDEYAILDKKGLVHPYPRRLSIRQENGQKTKRCPVTELGGQSGTEALPVGLVVYTQYHSEAQWKPIKMSMGEAGLALLDNTVVARLRPEFALPILSKVVLEASAVKGRRGDADETAKALLDSINGLV